MNRKPVAVKFDDGESCSISVACSYGTRVGAWPEVVLFDNGEIIPVVGYRTIPRGELALIHTLDNLETIAKRRIR